MAHALEFSCKQASCHCRRRLTNPCLFRDLSNHFPGPFETCVAPNACCGIYAKGALVASDCFDHRAHRMQDAIKKPAEDLHVEPVRLERHCVICRVSVFVICPIHMVRVISSHLMTWNRFFHFLPWRPSLCSMMVRGVVHKMVVTGETRQDFYPYMLWLGPCAKELSDSSSQSYDEQLVSIRILPCSMRHR
jgi:hypothetical protein